MGGYIGPAGTYGGCETGPYNPSQQRGQVEQNQHTAAIEAAQGQGENVERTAYAADDPRYAGGDKFDLGNEQTSL